MLEDSASLRAVELPGIRVAALIPSGTALMLNTIRRAGETATVTTREDATSEA